MMPSRMELSKEESRLGGPSKDGLFDFRLLHCRLVLFYIACHVLDGEQGAEEKAVHNSFRVDCRTAREFADERTFRSWVLRVLIDEALLIRHRRDEVNFGKRCVGTDDNLKGFGNTRTSDILMCWSGMSKGQLRTLTIIGCARLLTIRRLQQARYPRGKG